MVVELVVVGMGYPGENLKNKNKMVEIEVASWHVWGERDAPPQLRRSTKNEGM
jgi:hypothetical protein